MQCNPSTPQRCRVSLFNLQTSQEKYYSKVQNLRKVLLPKYIDFSIKWFFEKKKKSSSVSKAESHKITFSTRYKGNIYLEWLQVCAEGYMYFVLNVFLKPQEGIRFYIFSQIDLFITRKMTFLENMFWVVFVCFQ